MENQNVFGPISVTGCSAVGKDEVGYSPNHEVCSILFDSLRVELTPQSPELQGSRYFGVAIPVRFAPEIEWYRVNFQGYVFLPEGARARIAFKFIDTTFGLTFSSGEENYFRECVIRIPEAHRTGEAIEAMAFASILLEVERRDPSRQLLAVVDTLDIGPFFGSPPENGGCDVLF